VYKNSGTLLTVCEAVVAAAIVAPCSHGGCLRLVLYFRLVLPLCRPTRTETPNDQMAATGRISADEVRREYPSTDHSAQGVTTAAVSDKKP
jgi:hypothetical protein